MFRTSILRVIAVAVVLPALSCSKSPNSGNAPPMRGKIGMTCMDLTNPYFQFIADEMKKEAAKYGYAFIAQDGHNEPATQNSQLSDFIAQQVDAIFLNPADSKAAGEGVKRAYKAGIPVFTFDVEVTDEEAKELVIYHIGTDNFQGGQLAAESMMQVTGDRGKIAIITYPEITSCIQRRNGFVDYLKEHNSKLEIAVELSGLGRRENGYTVATDILQAHPDIVGIFAVNDPSALGAYAALKKAGRENDIKLIGFDASPAGKQAVFEKQLFDTPQQFPGKMAVDTVNAYIKYIGGNAMLKREFIPCQHYRYEDSVDDESRIKGTW